MAGVKVDLKTVQDLVSPNISECPYCGSKEYYWKQHISGRGIYNNSFDGSEPDNSAMYDNMQETPLGKFAYCCKCDKKIFRFKK